MNNNQENKKSKKKILIYYLILAACLLVIAAVTVTVIFAVRSNSSVVSVDSGNEEQDDDNNDNNGSADGNQDDDDDDSGNEDDGKNTSTAYEFILPVSSGETSNPYDFGYDVTLNRYSWHHGMDFDGNAGDNVYAVLDGTVIEIAYDDVLDGNYVTLSHTNGITTTYKFIDVADGLKVGDTVSRGTVIGTIATACGCEVLQGDHLHFELYVNGTMADPADYLDVDIK